MAERAPASSGALSSVAEKLGEFLSRDAARTRMLNGISRPWPVHPLQEVRRRALQSLDFKHKHGLLNTSDILQASACIWQCATVSCRWLTFCLHAGPHHHPQPAQ